MGQIPSSQTQLQLAPMCQAPWGEYPLWVGLPKGSEPITPSRRRGRVTRILVAPSWGICGSEFAPWFLGQTSLSSGRALGTLKGCFEVPTPKGPERGQCCEREWRWAWRSPGPSRWRAGEASWRSKPSPEGLDLAKKEAMRSKEGSSSQGKNGMRAKPEAQCRMAGPSWLRPSADLPREAGCCPSSSVQNSPSALGPERGPGPGKAHPVHSLKTCSED